jgi:hypothetical protein
MASKPEKKIRITTISDQPERSVADYLSFRPAPLLPPPQLKAPEGGCVSLANYTAYVDAYQYYLFSLSKIRKDFAEVFLRGGSYQMSSKDYVTPGDKVKTELSSSLQTLVDDLEVRSAELHQPTITSFATSGVGAHRDPQWVLQQQQRREVTEQLEALVRLQRLVSSVPPTISVIPKPAADEATLQKEAELKSVRRKNRNLRKAARRKAARAAAASPAAKLEVVTEQVKLAKAEAAWVRVLSSKEKSRLRKEKRKANSKEKAKTGQPAKAPASQVASVAPPPANSKPNRAERRRAIYGPPRTTGSNK